MFKKSKEGIILFLKIIPNASKNAFSEFKAEYLKIHLTETPEKGRANEALINFLAKNLKLNKSDIQIISGHTKSLKKVLLVNQGEKILEKIKVLII